MRKFIPNSKGSACLLASDSPSENPRTQTILIRDRCSAFTNQTSELNK